ncbi:MAG: hypothetical protein R2854_13645 [Caldilineaceae bacterium]
MTRAADPRRRRTAPGRANDSRRRAGPGRGKEAAVLVAAHQAGFDAYAAAQAEKTGHWMRRSARAQWQQQRATLETTLARLQAEMAGVEQAQGDVSGQGRRSRAHRAGRAAGGVDSVH